MNTGIRVIIPELAKKSWAILLRKSMHQRNKTQNTTQSTKLNRYLAYCMFAHIFHTHETFTSLKLHLIGFSITLLVVDCIILKNNSCWFRGPCTIVIIHAKLTFPVCVSSSVISANFSFLQSLVFLVFILPLLDSLSELSESVPDIDDKCRRNAKKIVQICMSDQNNI